MRLLTGFEGMPYGDADLKREFGLTHDVGPVDDPVTGRRWRGNRIGHPPILAAVEDTPAALAATLRSREAVIDRILNGNS